SISLCEQLGTRWNNQLDPFPLIEWINVSSLKSFYDPTFQSLLNQPLFFNEIDSLGQYQLAIQPYGFHSGYELDGNDFKLTTFGGTVNGSVTLKERWILGAGIGYWYSSFNWGDLAHDGSLNTIYVGPYLAYVFDRGYIDLEILGIYNIYNVDQVIAKGQEINNNTTKWDLYGSIEGGIDLKGPHFTGANFFIQPTVNLSYLASLSHELKLEDEENETTLTGGFSDFFRGKIAAEFRKEFHQQGKGFIIPALSIGWVLMQPLSHNNSTLTCGEEQNQSLFPKKYPSSQQLYVGAKFTTLSKSGFLFSLSADAYIAKLYPIYSGNVRFEWSW
ncbi:MAG: autotransporter outer membrane beta-barrel domain-containing protein, partial [Rhabdochlamydiaceae bacterium]